MVGWWITIYLVSITQAAVSPIPRSLRDSSIVKILLCSVQTICLIVQSFCSVETLFGICQRKKLDWDKLKGWQKYSSLESMSYLNKFYWCVTEIKHSNWLKLVTWLSTFNESALYQRCIIWFCHRLWGIMKLFIPK